jgi:hypothetical protein
MIKLSIFFLICAATRTFASSELTTTDEPETIDPGMAAMAAILKKAGTPAIELKSSRRVFLRNGVKVAALITRTNKLGNNPPETGKFIEFYIDANNWISISLDDPRRFESHFAEEASVSATNDSITVTAPKKGYCEVFFKSTGAFLDGDQREKVVPSVLQARTAAP